jgi:hypothetical protein
MKTTWPHPGPFAFFFFSHTNYPGQPQTFLPPTEVGLQLCATMPGQERFILTHSWVSVPDFRLVVGQKHHGGGHGGGNLFTSWEPGGKERAPELASFLLLPFLFHPGLQPTGWRRPHLGHLPP